MGIPSLGHIPGIWSKDWKPEAEAMDYLIAKGIGRWTGGDLRSGYAARNPLSAASMLAVGHDLTNFFDWCERRRVTWRNLSYGQVLEHYQGDMASGKWARINKGKPLSPATINRRMLSVTDFLKFAAQQGHRPPFEVEYTDVLDPRDIRRRSLTPRRVGKVRQHPKHLRLPTLDEISTWLNELHTKHGRTPSLIAKAAIGIGLRAEEVLLLRVDQVPKVPPAPAGTARMEICFGTKGGRDPQDPNKRGKPRNVRVPVDLLKDIHGYITGHRKLCLVRFRNQYPNAPAPKELFLSKYTGRPLGYDRFYDLWKSPASLPFKEFSPHLARHIWACYTLIEKIREEVSLSIGVDGPLSGLAANLHQNLIETWISTQLGHVDPRTSEMYLQWVTEQLNLESHRVSWWDFLNG
jgi:integrase